MKFCDACGRPLEDEAQFCDSCGRPQARITAPRAIGYRAREQPAVSPLTVNFPRIPDIPVFWKALILFVVAICARILFLEMVGFDYTGWYADSYHHWQIAYYTLHVGLAQNPPRMWDLSGQEYFWGLLPTLTESFLLYAFNTASLVPFRVFNSVTGSISVVLIYFLGRRFFDDKIGLIAGIATALSPVLLEIDTSGMLDPMGITLLLSGLLLYRKKPYLCGLVVGLASLVHIEFWFLALAVIAFYLIYEKSATDFVSALVGWLTPMLPYFYIMQTQTGEALYALHYNLLSSVGGTGLQGIPIPPFLDQVVPRTVFVFMLAFSLGSIVWLVKRKPPSSPFHSFFLARVAMHGIIFGFTSYVIPYIVFGQIPRVLIDRLFALEYYYLPFVVALIVLQMSRRFEETNQSFDKATTSHPVGKKWEAPHLSNMRGRLVVILMILLVFNVSVVPLVVYEYYTTYGSYQYQLQMADFISSHYQTGNIVNSLVTVNYRLISDGIPYRNVMGSLYCPAGGGRDAYQWLLKNNVTWLIVDSNLTNCYPSLLGNGTAPFISTQISQVYAVDQQQLLRLSQT